MMAPPEPNAKSDPVGVADLHQTQNLTLAATRDASNTLANNRKCV
jgi:hypothetical protein